MMEAQNIALENYLSELLGDEYEQFLHAEEEPPAIRVNTLKQSVERFAEKLRYWSVDFKPHVVNPQGFILASDDLPLSHTLAFFRGEFFYQGIASQLPVLALQPQPGETVLDIAAAPGSKATQLAALMQNHGRLWLNDASRRRMQPLLANLAAAGTINDVVTCLPGQIIGRQVPEFFDRVLLDAPCSALNIFPRRQALRRWSKGYLEKISYIQEQLLISAIKAAKVGGVIVYSTCSICPEEDEAVIDRIVRRYPVTIEALPFAGASFIGNGRLQYSTTTFHTDMVKTGRIHPYPQPVEGFFIARLRKTDSLPIRPVSQPMRFLPPLGVEDDRVVALLEQLERDWGLATQRLHPYRFLLNQHKAWIVHPDWQELPQDILVKAGLLLATRKTRGWKLSTAAVQFFAADLHRAFLDLEPSAVRQLFRAGYLPIARTSLQYHILRIEGRPFAVVSQNNGILKLHLPHRCEVIFDP